ncbi:hypothetical protein FRC17_000448 [Serendipita sp. 399]|nr:hypothetical protein FRC17_000448 [Serendipita sp. 399]
MLVNARCIVGTLCLIPLIAAVNGLQDPANYQLSNLRIRYDRRQLFPPGERSTTTTATPSSTSSSTVERSSTSTTPSSTSSSTSTQPTSTSSTSSSRSLATSAIETTNDEGEIVTEVVTVTPTSSASATPSGGSDGGKPSSSSKGTFIGLGVAGGVAVVALIGFIVWKMTQKRFQQFDNDDGGDINWPMPKDQLQAPAAPSMTAATNATSSSVDLTRDPYAVPPLPAGSMPYRDDPSGTAAAAYYDPYRGPVPHTFNSPPPSSDGHMQNKYGEAIPMSTYSSGRQSPGPNTMGGAYDDPYNRSRSPGPNMAYDDPYASGRRSPGPSVALGMTDPYVRAGTPTGMVAGVPPPRMGTPVGAGYGVPPPGLDIPRTGTPQGGYGGAYGRASPAPPQGFAAQQPLVDPYGRRTPNPYGP